MYLQSIHQKGKWRLMAVSYIYPKFRENVIHYFKIIERTQFLYYNNKEKEYQPNYSWSCGSCFLHIVSQYFMSAHRYTVVLNL